MNAVPLSLLAGLLAGSGCCLTVVSGDTGNDETGGGGSSSGGGSTSGGTTGGKVGCSGVYCSPAYVCDPADGICKCGGEICTSGKCDANTGACLPGGCTPDGGIAFLAEDSGQAAMLPPARLNETYDFHIGACAGSGPITLTALSPLPPGLALYPSGEVEGVPIMATNGVPFEFEVEAQTPNGTAAAFQNFLLQVE